MRRRLTMILAGLAALAALALGGAAIANATGVVGDDEGEKLSSSEAARAEAAALLAAGGGSVQESEREGTSYEVEVRKADGSIVEVQLDSSYRVVGVDGDQETDDGDGEQEDAGEN
jgi:predicted regulator of Ras-like GTPase activity (Roadblock/LC7/MglB family)